MQTKKSDAEFLTQLERLGRNWRYSDEFIGIIVRNRYPRDYSNLGTRRGTVAPAPMKESA